LRDPLQRLIEPLAVDWLDQIVDGAHLERPERELIIGSHEHDRRRLGVIQQLVRDVDARSARHADVEEGDVGSLCRDGGECLIAIRAFGHHLIVRVPRQQQAKPLACERFVVGDQDAMDGHHAETRSRRGSNRSGNRTSTTVPPLGGERSSSEASSP
jgi:hypothetical protein